MSTLAAGTMEHFMRQQNKCTKRRADMYEFAVLGRIDASMREARKESVTRCGQIPPSLAAFANAERQALGATLRGLPFCDCTPSCKNVTISRGCWNEHAFRALASAS